MIKNLLISFFLMILLTACSTITTTENTRNLHKTATAYNPTAANYNVQLGIGYLQQGDMARAKQKLLLALSQAPDWAQAQGAMAYYLENTGDNSLAEKYYLKALQLDPKSGQMQNNYGAFLCRMKRYPDSVQHFMIAVQDTNYLNTGEAYENAGLCAMQIPDQVRAAQFFQQAIQHDPRRVNAYLELAQINFNQNNFTQAQQYFNQYAALTPNMSPEGLWLGIRLARQANDEATAGRYVLTLQSKYPNSVEYKQLMALPKPKSQSKQLMY